MLASGLALDAGQLHLDAACFADHGQRPKTGQRARWEIREPAWLSRLGSCEQETRQCGWAPVNGARARFDRARVRMLREWIVTPGCRAGLHALGSDAFSPGDLRFQAFPSPSDAARRRISPARTRTRALVRHDEIRRSATTCGTRTPHPLRLTAAPYSAIPPGQSPPADAIEPFRMLRPGAGGAAGESRPAEAMAAAAFVSTLTTTSPARPPGESGSAPWSGPGKGRGPASWRARLRTSG